MKRLILKALKAVAWAGIYCALLWYGINAVHDTDRLDKIFIALTVFGVTYGISKPFFEAISEIVGGIMVIADFLNRHLLEPQKQRLLEQGREQGREEGREQGREEGREQGREEGREQGREEGRKEGREKALAIVRKHLTEDGLNLDDYMPIGEPDAPEGSE